VSSQDIDPQGNTSDLYGSLEGNRIFGTPCGNLASAFQAQENIFNPMPQFIAIGQTATRRQDKTT
jgi:hypothetical protein